MTLWTSSATSKVGDGETVNVTCLDRLGREVASVDVPRGTVLLKALEEAGFTYGPCGGYGSCGGCAVELGDGRLVQSCYVRANENLTVRKRSL